MAAFFWITVPDGVVGLWTWIRPGRRRGELTTLEFYEHGFRYLTATKDSRAGYDRLRRVKVFRGDVVLRLRGGGLVYVPSEIATPELKAFLRTEAAAK